MSEQAIRETFACLNCETVFERPPTCGARPMFCSPICGRRYREQRNKAAVRGVCECGCGGVTEGAPRTSKEKGWIAGTPLRFIRGHGSIKPRIPEQDLEVDPVTGCWNWLHCRVGPNSYGKLSHRGQEILAHRFYYEQAHGPIPEGLDLDHLCRNRGCVNPDHLEPVTRAVNAQRGARAVLTPALVRQIRASTLSHSQIAKQIGVAKATVSKVKRGGSWSNVS